MQHMLAAAAITQVLRDLGRPNWVIPNPGSDPSTQRLAADYPIHIGLGERIARENSCLRSNGAE